MDKSVGFAPVIQKDALLVILGSFPGQASLHAQQYYAFARNQFWPIVGVLLDQDDLHTFEYKKKLAFLQNHHIGLWDVYKACIREGSLDSHIRAGEANDLLALQKLAPGLKVIAYNGKTSAKFIEKTSLLGVQTMVLPSSSPAYASMRFEEKVEKWRLAFVEAGVI